MFKHSNLPFEENVYCLLSKTKKIVEQNYNLYSFKLKLFNEYQKEIIIRK